MAPGTVHLGGLAAAAVCVALAVAGCGGGSSSSAPATAGNTDARSATTGKSAGEGSSSGATNGGAPEGGGTGKAAEATGGGKNEKKHPPLEVPKGPPEKGPTKEQEEKVPTAEIAVSIPNGLTTVNTCKGKNVSPEITWTGVPTGTEELAIFAVNVQPVEGKLYFDWALAGVDPSVTSLKEGEVPSGAVLGRDGEGKNGWSLCPKKSGSETYIFSVYAIGKSLSPQEGFDPLTLRGEATPLSKEVGIEGVNFSG